MEDRNKRKEAEKADIRLRDCGDGRDGVMA
jgi:hypothetical protein